MVSIAEFCEERGLKSQEGVERYSELEEKANAARRSRRDVLIGGAAVAAGAALLSSNRAFADPRPPSGASIGIVGAGLAGLVCADTLKTAGLSYRIYEASSRVGGRQYSLHNFFPGQNAERGGEFIDNLHKTMLGYANKFNLALEDVEKSPGEVFYNFGGVDYPESVVVDQYRLFVAAMSDDLRTSTGVPTADLHNDGDVTLDNLSLTQYLDTRGALPVVRAAIIEAYEAEYGMPAEQQSSLNFLLFIHADKRGKFRPFGVYSDERYHVIEGNSRIAEGIANTLGNVIDFNQRLTRVAKTPQGKIELSFASGKVVQHDAVVIAIPFSVLRKIELSSTLGLPDWKTKAINEMGYGTNAKMMVGFNGPFWRNLGSNGVAYADLPNVQNTWETNPSRANSGNAILTDYSSGARGASLLPSRVQQHAADFVRDLELVFTGATNAAKRDKQGKYLVHLEAWPQNPQTLGSYTSYSVGQFTTICGNEGKPIGNLHFAGEHTNSFYEWQGFMEGAMLSGITSATEILEDIKKGRLVVS